MKKVLIVGLGFAAGMAPTAAAQEGVVRTSTVTREFTVTPAAPRSLTLRCPSTSVALNGAVTAGLGVLKESFPRSGVRRWTFRLSSPGGRRSGTALLRCVRLALPTGVRGVRLMVGTAVREIRLEPGSTGRVAVDCPFGQIPTGWGLERVRGGASLEVAAAVATSSRWVFKLENGGQSAATVRPRIRCLGRTQRARTGQRHRFSMRRAAFSDRVRRGASRGVSHSCRGDEFSVATGVSFDPEAELFLTRTYPLRERDGRWSFRQPDASSRVRTVLLCLDQSTRFR